jgi:hypothetical protein
MLILTYEIAQFKFPRSSQRDIRYGAVALSKSLGVISKLFGSHLGGHDLNDLGTIVSHINYIGERLRKRPKRHKKRRLSLAFLSGLENADSADVCWPFRVIIDPANAY